MNGSDHLLPQPWLGDVVAAANELQDDYRFAVTSLAEYVRAQPTDGLTTWDGELRSGARANVLMGVASNRVDVHQLAAHAERSLERYAEPLSALLLAPADYPTALLDVGWRQLVLNSAHDSSCACSADDVVEAVRVRYQEARHVGEALTREAVRTLATTVDVPASSTIVVNSTARDRGGVVSVPLPGRGPVHLVALDDGSRVPHAGGAHHDHRRGHLDRGRGPEDPLGAGDDARPRARGRAHQPGRARGTARRQSRVHLPRRRAGRGRGRPRDHQGSSSSRWVRRAPPSRSGSAARRCATCWWRRARCPASGGGRTARSRATARAPRCGPRASTLENEHVRAVVDPADGTLSVTVRRRDRRRVQPLRRRRRRRRHLQLLTAGRRHRGRPARVGGGDGHRIGSGPGADRRRPPATSCPHARSATSARARPAATSAWPPTSSPPTSCARASGSCGCTWNSTTASATTVCAAHFPLPAPVDGSDAECAFAVVHRGLTAEGGPHEFGLPTFVSRRFVDCSRRRWRWWRRRARARARRPARVRSRGRRHRARAHAACAPPATCRDRSRCCGPTRPVPSTASRGRSCRPRLALDYAVLVHRGDVYAADLPAVADDVLVPLERVRGGGWPGAIGPGARERARRRGRRGVGAPARRHRCARAAGGEPHPRRHRRSASRATARRVTGIVVDLTGAELGAVHGRAALRPWELLTLRLADALIRVRVLDRAAACGGPRSGTTPRSAMRRR